jgi:erythromycin esterase
MVVEKGKLTYYQLKTSRDLDPLIENIKVKYVLLGEASHGTHEYYTWRTAITKRLIEEKGYTFVAVEGDWPDCYILNRYVKGYYNDATTALDVLKTFSRWPTWMWANWEIAALLEWMREYNKGREFRHKVGFYGLDVYSLWESMDVIINYLRKEDPVSARLAIDAYRCFEPYKEGYDYAQAIVRLSADCKDEVVDLLKRVRRRARNYNHDPEASLNAEVNAQVIANAEEYYRSMVSFRDESWNIRDNHMVNTLEALMDFHGKGAKSIVWAHNSHVGDARYTNLRGAGTVNVGQLIRENHAEKSGVYIVGFASYDGTVIAGKEWGGPIEKMTVPLALSGSIEHLLHEESMDDKLILLDDPYWKERLRDYLPHRAIGVVYNPTAEHGNYVLSQVPARFDALIYLDKTSALHPLHQKHIVFEMPETYPFGL